MTMPTVRRSASSEAREPLLPMSHNVTESIEPEVSRAADKFALVAKKSVFATLGAATSTVLGGTIGYGLGLFEGNAEAGLRRMTGDGAHQLVAERGLDGLRLGAAGLGVLGLATGFNGLRLGRLTRYLAAGASGASSAVVLSAATGYVGAATASLLCAATSRALGFETYPLANQAWDAGAVAGVLVGIVLGGGSGGRAFWPH